MIAVRQVGTAFMALLWALPVSAAAPSDEAFTAWARARAVTLPACSSISLGADFAAIGKTIGGARVVALGEPVHGAHEPLAFRNCLFRYLVEEQGFTAIAIETGLNESRRLHNYAAGGPGNARDISRSGFTWGFWRFPENIELLEWIRAYNLDPRHPRKIGFYGIDVSGGDADGAWARARITLDEGIAYLARAAPTNSERARRGIAPFLDHFSAPAYRSLPSSMRGRLRQAIANLLRVFDSNRSVLIASSSVEDYSWARQNVVAAGQLQALFDVSRAPDPEDRLLPGDYRADAVRDAAMAENALWALDRSGPQGRILLFAHNGHVMNARTRGGIWGAYAKPPAAMGVRLRRVLGRNLLIMGTSSPTRSENAVDPASIDAALAATGKEHFLLDLRSPPNAARAWLSREQSIGVNYTTENLLTPRGAFDTFVFFAKLTPSQNAL